MVKYNETHYFLTTELYGETANTIISEMHEVILHLFTKIIKPEIKEIYFVLDNHSTNKNFTVFAYLDYLVFFSLIKL